jgi:hypothetical protein
MRQGVVDEVGNVPIRERVKDVSAFAAAGDQPFAAKNAKALGNRGECLLGGLDDLGDAAFPAAQHLQDAEPGCIAHRAEQRCGALERGGAVSLGMPLVLGVIAGLTGCNGFANGSPLFYHFMSY